MTDGRNRSKANLLKNAEAAKEETTAKFEAKVAAFQSALRSRLQNPTEGLPRSVSSFLRWRGDGGDLEDLTTSRSSLNDASRKELKDSIEAVIESVKNPPVATNASLVDENKVLADRQKRQLEGLAAANHLLEVELDEMKRQFKSVEIERDRLLRNIEAQSKSTRKPVIPGRI